MFKTPEMDREAVKPAKPRTRLQELEAQTKALRKEVADEKKRIKHDRSNRSERIHVLTLLGKVVDHKGKNQIVTVLEKAECLTEEEKLAVEYFYGLRERPPIAKKTKADVPSV